MRAVLLVGLIALAGCAEAPTPVDDGGVPATDTTGCIRGVVVDDSITPIEGARIDLAGQEAATTDSQGAFLLCELEPGTYVLEASHPLYNTVQATATVEAGDSQPPVAKLQLTREVFLEPYTQQEHVIGYIVCSSNAGGVIAEECGEGAGAPCGVPVVGCQRIGGAPDNEPEARFYTDGGPIRTIQAEVIWEPSFTIDDNVQSGGFTAIMAVNHICDPVCRYTHSLDDKVGQSPLIMRTEDGDQGSTRYFTASDKTLAEANITKEDWVSVFVWQTDQDAAGVTFDQEFEVLVTIAYGLPLPEEWAVMNGDQPPF